MGVHNSVKGIATGRVLSVSCDGRVFYWAVIQVDKVTRVVSLRFMPPNSTWPRVYFWCLTDGLEDLLPMWVTPKGPSIFEIASLAVATAAQDEDMVTDAELRVIQATCGNCPPP